MAAEFDNCARPAGEWVGFDQGIGESFGRAIATSGNNVYLAGEGSGALSFGTSHSNGKYYDHLGSHDAHKDHTQVATDAPHVETGSVVGGSYTDATNSRYGRDHFVYKLGDKGEPVSVYAADLTTIEGGTPTSDSPAIRARPEALAAIGSDVFVQGVYYGKLTFPNAKAGGNIELVNSNTADQSGFYDLWVAKLDMSTTPPSAAWVVSPGDFQVKTRGAGIAVTAAGHVLTFHDDEKAKWRRHQVQWRRRRCCVGEELWQGHCYLPRHQDVDLRREGVLDRQLQGQGLDDVCTCASHHDLLR
jgi:hypothetical protein